MRLQGDTSTDKVYGEIGRADLQSVQGTDAERYMFTMQLVEVELNGLVTLLQYSSDKELERDQSNEKNDRNAIVLCSRRRKF